MKTKICIISAVLVACSALLSGCGFDNSKLISIDSSAVSDSVAVSDSGTSQAVQGSVSPELYNDDIAQFAVLNGDTYYFKGDMTDNTGTTTPMEMAKFGDMLYLTSQMSGVTIGFMRKGTDYYMVYPDEQCSLLMDDTVCKTLDMNPEDMNFDSAISIGDSLNDITLLDESDALVDGDIATCRTYRQESGAIAKTYIQNGCLVKLETYGSDGIFVSSMRLYALTSEVPDYILNATESYKVFEGVTGMARFMMKLMGTMDMDSLTSDTQ